MTVLNKSTIKQVWVDSKIHRALKALSAHSGVSMSALAGQFIQAGLARAGK